MRKHFILFLMIISIWSCKKDAEDRPKIFTYDEPTAVVLLTPDEEIIEKTYSPNYYYPADFTFEKDLDGSLYYENTVSTRKNEGVWIELHTNDKVQAKAWSETASKRSSYYRDLVRERETEKYFEYKRVYSITPTDVLLSRIHKSSYFIPLLDKSKKNKEIGIFKKTPITKESSKHLGEYLWSGSIAGWTGKVIETKIIELPNSFQYNLKTVRRLSGDILIKDTIEIWDFNFLVHKQTGEVFSYSTKIKDLQGR